MSMFKWHNQHQIYKRDLRQHTQRSEADGPCRPRWKVQCLSEHIARVPSGISLVPYARSYSITRSAGVKHPADRLGGHAEA